MALAKSKQSPSEVLAVLPEVEPANNGALSFPQYVVAERNGSTAKMVNKPLTGKHGDTAKPAPAKSKGPTAFSKAFPPKIKSFPEKFKAVATWRPTHRLSLGKDQGKKAG